ncbi:MAG: FeoB-associated Cys-rich membrane protein [Rikenellaceae bacterium]
MQEIVTYIIGIIAAALICMRLYRAIKGTKKKGCTTCQGCKYNKEHHD